MSQKNYRSIEPSDLLTAEGRKIIEGGRGGKNPPEATIKKGRARERKKGCRKKKLDRGGKLTPGEGRGEGGTLPRFATAYMYITKRPKFSG